MTSRFRAALFAASALTLLPAALSPVMAQEDKAGGNPAAGAPAAPVKDYTIIKLGGEDIKYSEVADTWKNLFPGGNAPDFSTFDENVRQNVLRGIIAERLLYQQAVKAGVENSDTVKKRIAAMEKQIVIQAFMEQEAKNLVTDEQLRAAYAEKVAANKGQEEVKARHILVPTEAEAKEISQQLKKNPADFEKIAKEKSTDKGSGAQGGELGWFAKDKMVPAFAEAAFKMKKGEISDPVKTDFGWHVIQVEDRRPVQMQSFDEMKESLKGELAGKAVQTYVEGLLKNADIKYYGTDGKEKPFTREMAPPKVGAAAEKP